MNRVRCPACDTEHAESALSCPNCHRLTRGDQLKQLSGQAQMAKAAADVAAEQTAWRQALPLLPAGARQRTTIERRLSELEAMPSPDTGAPASAKKGGVLGVLALIAWKFKTVLLLALGKLKFLALGLSKMSTVLSFLASFGVYWSLWGWKYALGFLVAMYIHEMGHVASLRHYGIPASAPMFVPGLGAFVRMNQRPATPGEDARIGLAGPEWGFAAALASYALFWLTGSPIFAAIGHSAAYLNLFNLIPVWQLDGSRGFAALARVQRGIVTVAFVVCWALTKEGILGLISLVSLVRVFYLDLPVRGDSGVLARFVWLIVAFSLMLLLGNPRV